MMIYDPSPLQRAAVFPSEKKRYGNTASNLIKAGGAGVLGGEDGWMGSRLREIGTMRTCHFAGGLGGSSPGPRLTEDVRWLVDGRGLGFPGMSIGAEASDTESDSMSCVSIEPGVGHLGDVGPCEVRVVTLVSGGDSGNFSERQLELSRQLRPSESFPSTTASRLMAKDPGLNGSCIEGGIDALRLSSSLLLSTRSRDCCRG